MSERAKAWCGPLAVVLVGGGLACGTINVEPPGPAAPGRDAAVVNPEADGASLQGVDAGTLSGDDAAAPAPDAQAQGPDAATVEGPDAAVEGEPDARGSGLADGGVYPNLPASCQGLLNRTHGSCADAYASPDYGSIAWEHKGAVEQAIASVGQPAGMFDGDTVFPDKRADYVRLVAAALDGVGYCAAGDGSEVYVRDRITDYNEAYSLFTAAGRPRAGGHWQCEPSDQIPGTRPAFACSVPASSNPACSGPGQNLFGDVVAMVEEVIAEEQAKPASEVIDFAFKSLHVRGWRLKDDGYPFVERVARKANARGYCVVSSGWKWISIKTDNALSESYSLVTHVSLPDPATKPALYAACLSDGILPSCEFIIEKNEETCRPAGF